MMTNSSGFVFYCISIIIISFIEGLDRDVLQFGYIMIIVMNYELIETYG